MMEIEKKKCSVCHNLEPMVRNCPLCSGKGQIKVREKKFETIGRDFFLFRDVIPDVLKQQAEEK